MKLMSLLRGTGTALLAATLCSSTAAGAVMPGTTVLNSNWETLGGVTIATPTNGVTPSWITDDASQSKNWNAVGGFDSTRKIEFTNGQNSPFGGGNVGAVFVGDPANNGPRFNADVADLGNNPFGLSFQFDAKINDNDSFGGIRIATNFSTGNHLGVRFGNAGAGVGKILVPTAIGTGFVGSQAIADFETGVWYRFVLTVHGALATATTFDLHMTKYGEPTQTFSNLTVHPDINRTALVNLEIHPWNLDDSLSGTRGEMVVDNVVVVVPEPSTAIVLGLGMLMTLRHPRARCK